MRVILFVIFLFTVSKGYSQCGTPTVHQLTHTSPGELYRPSTAGWNPGDTLKIMESTYSVVEIFGGGGSVTCPIIIVANTSFHSDVIRFKGGANYYKIISTGAGTDTNSIRSISAKNVALDKAAHITVEGLKIRGADVGIYNKMNVSYADQSSWYPNFPQTGNRFIGCWISDINGEGLYSGLTQNDGYVVTSTWSGLDTTIVGNRTDSTVVMNCVFYRTQWDACQLSHSGYGNIIANNVIRDFGLADLTGQRAGIILGGDCNGEVYGNDVKRGMGNGIEIFGFGSINVYGNTIDSVGNTLETLNGEESLYCVYHTVTYISRPPLALYIHDNQINNPKLRGAIRNSTNGNEIGSLIANNTFCIPGAAENWQDTYLILDVPGTTNTNNTLYCETSCNCVITNILRNGKYIN